MSEGESTCRCPGSKKAVREADRLRGGLPEFRRKVDRSLRLISGAPVPVGVSFSGGKDSTVCLHLVRRVFPDAVAGHFDSGAELPDTTDFIRRTPGVQMIEVEGGGLFELCRQNGYWGREPLSENPKRVDFFRALVLDPARRFVEENGLATVVIGLRGEESASRRVREKVGGPFHVMKDGLAHLYPLQGWTDDDVWAYIASENLDYNLVYDRMAELGLERRHWRVGITLSADTANYGMFTVLKQLDPGLWNRLATEFPLVRKYV